MDLGVGERDRGRSAEEARHLIVTDKDFGRASLRNAWAAQFLERTFASFTVLFVGRSECRQVSWSSNGSRSMTWHQ